MAVGVLWLAVAGSDDDLEDSDIPLVQQDAMGFASGDRTVEVIGPMPQGGVDTHVVKVRWHGAPGGPGADGDRAVVLPVGVSTSATRSPAERWRSRSRLNTPGRATSPFASSSCDPGPRCAAAGRNCRPVRVEDGAEGALSLIESNLSELHELSIVDCVEPSLAGGG